MRPQKGKELKGQRSGIMSFDWLSSATEIGVDTETKDPHLRSKGPGVFRKDGYVVGVSLATKERQSIWTLRILIPLLNARSATCA